MMKKVITITTAIILVILTLMTSGCNSNQTQIVGTWEAEMDLSKLLTEQCKEELGEDVAQYMVFSDVVIDIETVFNNDNTCSMKCVEGSTKKASEQMFSCIKEGMHKFIEAQLEENKIDITLDDFFEQYEAENGYSFDEQLESEFSAKNYISITDEIENGPYKEKNGIIHIWQDDNTQSTEYAQFTLKEGKLYFYGSEQDNEEIKELLPIIFTKNEAPTSGQ